MGGGGGSTAAPHQVVIVGGGFGGLRAARTLRGAPVEVTLIDRRNFHLFQPLLYQVATGALSPGDIASPLRHILRRQRNARVWLAAVTGIDAASRRIRLPDGEVPYDTLLVAAGAGYQYFGHDDWQPLAPGLKTVEEALDIRARIFSAFEAAEREPDEAARRAWLTFVIVGGGPTGVELAGALGEIAHDTLRHEFRAIDPREARIVLIEGAERVLPSYPADLCDKASTSLARLGVTVRTGANVVRIARDTVTVQSAGADQEIPARVVLWAAGVKAAPLAAILAAATGAPVDRAGRIVVEPDLSVAGHPEIFVIGDMAHTRDGEGKPLPGVAPVAMQQGSYVAGVIRDRLRGQATPPFRYRDRGSMATIGRAAAVADLGWIRFAGLPAWLAWLFVHLMNIVGFENRVLVLLQWAWSYLTWNRGARLITAEPGAGVSMVQMGLPRRRPGVKQTNGGDEHD